VALAQVSDDERARSHFMAGSSYFDQRRYVDAAEQFAEAYRLSGRTELLLNIATSYEHASEPGQAADALATWLEVAPADAPDRRTQETRLVQLRAAAEARALEAEREAQAAAAAQSSEPVTEEPDRLGGLGITGIALMGVGVGGGAVAIGTGIASSNRLEELESGCDAALVCPPELRATRDRGRTLATVSTISTFVSVASLGAGVVMLLLDLRQTNDGSVEESGDGERAAQLRLAPGPGDIGLGAAIAF
jgi:hypothetical protein